MTDNLGDHGDADGSHGDHYCNCCLVMVGLVFDRVALCKICTVDNEGFCILMVPLEMSMAITMVMGEGH